MAKKKKIEVVVRQGLKLDGKYPAIGSRIELDESEAARLLKLQVVSMPIAEPPRENLAAQKAGDEAMIAKIQAAESLEEIEALNIEDPSPQVLAAAQKRAEELTQN